MESTVNAAIRLDVVTCCECGTVFGIAHELNQQLLGNSRYFFCPVGHRQFWSDSELIRVKRDLQRERAARDQAQADARQKSLALLRAELKVARFMKRVVNGVCPCCERSFQNMKRHMATKHPEYVNT